MADAINHQTVACRVKWFDPKKGFGFLISDRGGPDILLHANVLRNAGRGSIASEVRLEAIVDEVDGRWQATAISSVSIEVDRTLPTLTQFDELDPETLQSLPYLPARVKWFDLAKGFGFANVFGSPKDIFIHIEVLRASGLAGLEAGEAIALRITEGDRGRMAVEVAGWVSGCTDVE
jgi:CspA family cold shock protein